MKSRFHTCWPIAAAIALTLILSCPARGERIPVKFLQEDFRIMRHALEEAHGGIYRYTSKAEMDRTFDRAYRKIDHPMTDIEFWRLAAPVVAHIKCGHTYLSFPKAVQTVPIFAADTSVLHDRVFGIEQYGESSGSLAGKEILSINRVPTHKLLGELRSIITGDGNSQTAKDWEIGHDGGFGIYLYGLGIRSPFVVDCRDREGKRERIELSGMIMPDFIKMRLERHPELTTHAEIKFLDEGKIAVLTIRQWSHYVDPAHKITFSDFLKKSFAQLRKNGTGNLIIDVRNDSGGLDVPVVELFGYLWNESFDVYRDINCNAREFDFFKYDPDAKPMPGELLKGADGKLHVIKQAGLGAQQPLEPHYPGRVFALMNGGSFSSSTEFLTLLHFHKRAKFIGEEPAGAYYGYTCGRMVCPILPNSKLELNFGILTFYLDVSGYKYSDHGVLPDYPVAYTPADLLAGKDKEMELALSLARSKN
jgi:hypothetical protein